MSDILERARLTRQAAQDGRVAALRRNAEAHERAALMARRLARLLQTSGHAAASALHHQRASLHDAAAAMALHRADRVSRPDPSILDVRVHMGFADAGVRDSVLALLRELGPWAGGDLVDDPEGGAHFAMRAHDLALCEVAVRERLRVALAGTGALETLVSVHAVRPVRAA